MRTFLFSIYLLVSSSCISQSNISAGGERISYYTSSRDTLWLVNKEIGRLIAYTWELTSDVAIKPVIVLVDKLPERNGSIVEAKFTRPRKRRDE